MAEERTLKPMTVTPKEAPIRAYFDLPPELAERYKKEAPTGKISFPIPPDTPVDKREEVASKMYEQWAINQASYIPPEQTPDVDKIGVFPAMYEGLKKAGSDVLAGTKQLVYAAQKTNPIVSSTSEQENAPLNKKIADLAKEQELRTAKYEEIRKQRPIAAPTGEMLPYLATRSPLLVSAAESLKYGEPGERVVRGVLAGGATAVGNLLGGGAAKYVNPDVGPTTLKAIQNVKPLGVTPRLSELTGSQTLAGLEDVVMQAPFGGALKTAEQTNQLAYNRATAQAIGMDSNALKAAKLPENVLSDEVLAAAREKIGVVFEAVKALPVDVAPIRFTQRVEKAADKIIHDAAVAERLHQTGVVDPQLLKTATAWRDMFINGDFISGADYLIARNNLSDLAWAAEGPAKILYRDLLNALDDSAEASLRQVGQQELSAQLKIVRPQYSNLLTIEKGNVITNGNVNIKLLRNAVKQGKESAYKEGRSSNDLTKLSKYSEATAPLREGSPTATRGFYKSLVDNPIVGSLMAIPNAALANVLASPITKFIPQHLAGTQLGNVLGQSLTRGAKIPSIEAEQNLIMRRLYGPFQDDTTVQPSEPKRRGGLAHLSE